MKVLGADVEALMRQKRWPGMAWVLTRVLAFRYVSDRRGLRQFREELRQASRVNKTPHELYDVLFAATLQRRGVAV